MDYEQERARIIAEHGGLSDAKCAWRGCPHQALADMAFCFDHVNPDFGDYIAAQRPEWATVVESDDFDRAPEHLHSAEDALNLLGWAAKCWDDFRGWSPEDQGPQEGHPHFNHRDRQLARFVTDNPGALEALLNDPDHQHRLAYTRTRTAARSYREGIKHGGLPDSVLSRFLATATPAEGAFLWRTVQACDPVALCRFAIHCHSRFEAVLHSHEVEEFLFHTARWLGTERVAQIAMQLQDIATPELLDALRVSTLAEEQGPLWQARPEPRLPAILPVSDAAIVELGAEEICQRIAHYRGLSVDALHEMLVQQRFLGDGENLGEVIVRDARTLCDLGVSRQRLAFALRDAFLLDLRMVPDADESGQPSPHGPGPGLQQTIGQQSNENQHSTTQRQLSLQVCFEPNFGHHWDPFHSFNTLYISNEVGGSADCEIVSEAGRITLSDMHPYLIRRACFFEGAVPYRLDPELACRVLGLI